MQNNGCNYSVTYLNHYAFDGRQEDKRFLDYIVAVILRMQSPFNSFINTVLICCCRSSSTAYLNVATFSKIA
jgi:hypothetical protein